MYDFGYGGGKIRV